ncbi:MAG: carbohydrate binding family 9 domain-containing protein [Deltaproteobacteria bacterium]|nr:carbohydrate binding family 9 domain-containing protein [Deltaproteobacteria bacterium]
MRSRRLAPLPALVLSLATAAEAQTRPEVTASVVDDGVMAIDGRLDEAAWDAAEFGGGFTQRQPRDGEPATEETRFAVLRGERALYVGIECLDREPEAIVARRGRLDQSMQSDTVLVDLDTRGDGSTAFHFEVTAGGGRLDGVRGSDGSVDAAWDGVWDAAVEISGSGWTVELALPLSTLRFSDGLADIAFQVRRKLMRLQETDVWAPMPRSSSGEIVHYGLLTGLGELPEPWPLDLTPYDLRGFVYRSAADDGTTASGFEPRWSLGLDATLRLGSSLALTAAVNPDFGQIEADELVLNLSTIETWYEEKRPFFLADRELFATPLELFHTRRIGAVPAPPALPDGWLLDRRPDETRIWEALKLGGELAPGWTIGAVAALTGEESVGSVGPAGRRAARLAAPLSHFAVLRLRHDFGCDTAVGLLATAVNRFEPEAHADGLCPDGRSPHDGRCTSDAYVAAVDGNFRSEDGDWAGAAQAALTALVGGPPRLLADGTSLDPGDLGWAAAAWTAKGGEPWRARLETDAYSAESWVNDLGYQSRGNIWRLYANAGWWTDDLSDSVQTVQVRGEVWERVSLDGLMLFHRYGVEADTLLEGNNWLMLRLHATPPAWDDRELRDGAAFLRRGWAGFEVDVSTDYRYPVTLDMWGEVLFWEGRWSAYVEASVIVKPADVLTIELAPTLDFQAGEPARVAVTEAAGERRYLLGDLEASAIGVTMRATWAITPRLSLQGYGQLFLAAADYGPFRELRASAGTRPRIEPEDLSPAAEPADDPDFSQAAVNASVVLRWEYLPGSTIYVVYTHQQVPTEEYGEGRLDLEGLRDASWTEMVLLKASYLWN